jgi:hypothetical protein
MRIVWQIILGSFATLLMLLTLIFVYLIAYEGIYKEWIYPNIPKGDKYIEFSKENNSIAPFHQNDKWGYMNLLTDEYIPAQFDCAWPFSEGIAAVIKDKKLMFINPKGEIVINKELGKMPEEADCRFMNGYCIANSTEGLTGLIDKHGNWALEPIYDDIYHENGFWKVRSNELYGLFTAKLDTMFTIEHPRITVEDKAIEVSYPNHIVKRYDYDMNVLEDFVIHSVGELSTREFYQEDEFRYAVAKQMCYAVNAVDASTLYYGLMDRNGKRITPPVFTSIEAIGMDLYFCEPQGIVINGKGKRVE